MTAVIVHTECINILPNFRSYTPLPDPSFVCVTFPFCYRTRQGLWIPWSKSNTNSLLQKDVALQSSECWLEGSFCRSDASTLIENLNLDTAEDCQAKCSQTDGCQIFSFHHTRGLGHCPLMSECWVSTKCNAENKCVTGHQTCSCPKLEYLHGNQKSTRYARWNCGDIDPYSTAVPLNTICSISCPSWKDTKLQSTCLQSGKWSSTEPPLGSERSLGYAASYPTPDQPDMVCGCQKVGPFTYDPNSELGAEFVCHGWEARQYEKAGGWTITNKDRCDLYCSNGEYFINY